MRFKSYLNEDSDKVSLSTGSTKGARKYISITVGQYAMYVLEDGSIKFHQDMRVIPTLPESGESQIISAFYNKHKSEIMDYLKNPSNDLWWKLKGEEK